MGIVLTVMNMKGGVGKTTVAMHLAGGVGAFLYDNKPRKALLIDYDPQFNASQSFLPPKQYFSLEKARKTTLSVLVDDDADLNPYQIQVPGSHIPPSVNEISTSIYNHSGGKGGLDIVPSTLDLMYVALGQSGTKTQPMEERFEKFVNECRSLYDLVVIDCHPAGSLFTKTSLRNSDHVIIPVMPDSSYAVRGIGLMMQFIKAKKAGEKSPEPHILLNATQRTGMSAKEASFRANAEVSQYCMTASLKRFKAFSIPDGGKDFVWQSGRPYSGAAKLNMHQVNREILKRTGA